jgi:HK97 gp10 family phage protein
VAVKVTFRVEGLKECEEALKALPFATSKNVLRRALKVAAEPVASDAQQRVAKLTGQLGRSITVGTKLGSKRQRKEASKTREGVEVYVGAGPLPHAHIVEFGSSRQAADPFLRPAVDANGKQIMETFRDELRAEVSKAMQRHERKAARLAAKMKGT